MPECAGTVCQAKSEKIGRMCHSDGFSGNIIYLELPDGTECYCKCSCMAGNTLIAISQETWKPISEISIGDDVLTLSANGNWTATPVEFSDGTRPAGSKIPFVVYIKLENGTALIVTPEHPFLLPDKSFRTANRLTLSDQLADEQLNPVKIESLGYGHYDGAIRHISTISETDNPNPFWGHLINTAGVISGDFVIQLHLQQIQSNEAENPRIGSIEYLNLHGDVQQKFLLYFDTLLEEASKHGQNLVGELGIDPLFVPYRKMVAPVEFAGFLPPEMEIAAPGTLRALDDTVPLEIAESLAHLFMKSYPGITIDIDWPNNTVNAIAWRNGDQRRVTIYGGLIRNIYIKAEGVALVLAHEIGHHLGGEPRYPNLSWASCEGQADYWGALICMREVWWADEALAKTKLGAQQLYNLFAYGVVAGNESSLWERIRMLGTCTHPPADCRYQTYLAALRADDKPSCAGDPSQQ